MHGAETTQPPQSAGTPRQEAQGPFEGVTYGIAPDGERLLMIQAAEIGQAQAQMNIVINWAEELKRLVPTNQPRGSAP
jgi:hypothetical protein